ncbi:MAG: cytidylate kinase-like family protein [Desulfobacteraceae bacterium]|nr:cytidylate kinase-like family protein [Desulfobacteraceae bacterium]
MKAITFFGGIYTGAEQLAGKTASALGCRVIHDRELIEKTSETHMLKVSDIEKSIYSDPPFPERFSPGRAKCIAAVKSVLAEELKMEAAVFSGFLGELIPPEMALHVLVTSGSDYRSRQIFREKGIAGEHAADRIRQEDEGFFRWTHYLEETEQWNMSECHAIVASDHMNHVDVIEEIARAVEEKKQDTATENAGVEDFALAAKVASVMAEKRHPVAVSAHNAQVELTILNHVLMLSRYEKKLAAIASAVPGVQEVRTSVGPHFYKADVYRKWEFALSSKALFRSIEKKYENVRQQIPGNRLPFTEKRPENHMTLSSRV